LHNGSESSGLFVFKYIQEIQMTKNKKDSLPKRIGLASDHGGFELKQEIAKNLRLNNYEVVDFGNNQLKQDDDYPDYVVPMARAVASGEVDRGIAVCGSGVGACVAVNKAKGVRACLINDTFSAHQGVEDDNINIICLGGRVLGQALAWELVKTFLSAQFSGAERHVRRLAKVEELENGGTEL
jgi:ribose 5-phosphate isomerase B